MHLSGGRAFQLEGRPSAKDVLVVFEEQKEAMCTIV